MNQYFETSPATKKRITSSVAENQKSKLNLGLLALLITSLKYLIGLKKKKKRLKICN